MIIRRGDDSFFTADEKNGAVRVRLSLIYIQPVIFQAFPGKIPRFFGVTAFFPENTCRCEARHKGKPLTEVVSGYARARALA